MKKSKKSSASATKRPRAKSLLTLRDVIGDATRLSDVSVEEKALNAQSPAFFLRTKLGVPKSALNYDNVRALPIGLGLPAREAGNYALWASEAF